MTAVSGLVLLDTNVVLFLLRGNDFGRRIDATCNLLRRPERPLISRGLCLLPLLAAACAPPAPTPTLPVHLPATPPTIVSAAPPTREIDPAMVSVAAVSLPAGFTVDGDLAEWGSLLPPVPPPPKGPPAPSLPDLNPRDAASHVAFAVHGGGVAIAAQLASAAARDGVWLGIGTEAPPVPDIGLMQRGGGVIAFDCQIGTVVPCDQPANFARS